MNSPDTALVSLKTDQPPVIAPVAGLSSAIKHVLRSPPGHSGPLTVKPGNPAPADVDKETTMAKKPTKPTSPRIVRGRAPTSRKAAPTPAKPTSKQDQALALLRRQEGASIDEIVATTDWQPHSVRGFLSAAVKKRLGIDVISEKGEDGVRRYHVAALKS